MSDQPTAYPFEGKINGHQIRRVLIGRHYVVKHGHYMTDQLILDLVANLDGGTYPVDSTNNGIEYYVADIEHGIPVKIYRLIWLFEGNAMEIVGVINAYRKNKRRKK